MVYCISITPSISTQQCSMTLLPYNIILIFADITPAIFIVVSFIHKFSISTQTTTTTSHSIWGRITKKKEIYDSPQKRRIKEKKNISKDGKKYCQISKRNDVNDLFVFIIIIIPFVIPFKMTFKPS